MLYLYNDRNPEVKGDLGADAQEIFDAFGLNRYYVMSDNELRIVYLTK